MMTEQELPHPTTESDAGFGSLSTDKGHLPLRAMTVDARIVGLVSEVTLEQTFSNTVGEPIEATYIFPLPDRAGVTHFRMEVGGRVVEGEIKERGEARRVYTEALEAGHRAAITEEERPGVFTLRVGNLMPGDDAKVTLVMSSPLPYDDGEATFRFPLVVAPRYIPGTPLPGESVGDGTAEDTNLVPDASRISPPVMLPGFPSPVRLKLSVELDPGGLTFSNVRSSLHAVVETTSGARQRLELRPGERLNRDFVLRFGVGAEAVKSTLLLQPDSDGESRAGTFLLTLVPPPALARAEKPRDVVFVLDRSGSMDGWKMLAARRATSRMVDTLRDKDRFQVFAFDDAIQSPSAFAGRDLVAASDRNRFRAVEFLASLAAGGGTELAAPLELAAQRLSGGYEDRDRVLVLVTDGQVGNEDHILKKMQGLVKNIRIFTLGIDRAVNEAFLKRLAALGGGLSEIVESEERLDEVMDKIHRRIATPVLTELALVPSGLELAPDSVTPRRIPDVFSSAPVTILGRYLAASSGGAAPRGALTLKGKTSLGKAWSTEIHAENAANGAIPTIWARAQIRELEDRFVVGRGDKAQLEREIVRISLRHRVLSRFTAFVAVDRSAHVNPGGERHTIVQPVEAPDGWAMLQGLPPAPASMGAMRPSGGALPPAASIGAMRMSVPTSSARSDASSAFDRNEMDDEAPRFYDRHGGAATPAFDRNDVDDEAEMPVPASYSPTEVRDAGPAGPAKRFLSRLFSPRTAPPPPPAAAFVPQAPAPKLEMPDAMFEAYRIRARELLTGLRTALASASSLDLRLRALETLAAGLKVLIEDLTSVGAPRDQVEPLSSLFETLRDRLGEPALGPAEADALVARTEEVLERLLDPRAAPTRSSAKREDFWK